jgi:Tol biopolymer transport system component
VTTNATEAGLILGTGAYMAPEQARGQQVDRRADIFAFGCVLYEMLAGRPAFAGENVADILSRVLQREPDWTPLPSSVTPSIHRLLRLCFEKDVQKRRQSAGDVRIDLENALAEPVAVSPPGPSRGWRVAWLALLAVLIVTAVPGFIHFRELPAREVRLQIVPPPTLRPQHFALSPDGQYIAFVALRGANDSQHVLFLRRLDSTDAKPIAGTEGAQYPFWSPDSKSIGFFASEKLLRIDIAGGPPQTLTHTANPQGGAWGEDGWILFAPTTVTPIMRVPASGGAPIAVTELDSPRQTAHLRPSILPGGRQFLFYVTGEPEVSGIYLGSFDGKAARRLTPATSSGAYLAPGYVAFGQQGGLVARRFDATRQELTGDPIALAPSVAGLSASAAGILAYHPGGGVRTRMTWFDQTGKVLERGADLNAPDLSSDGRYLAYDRTVQGNRDVWFRDLARGGGPTRFTTHPKVDGFPVLSPDNSQIAFHSLRNGNFDIWIKALNGAADTEQLLHGTSENEWPLDWSNDGRFLLYRKTDADYASSDLMALPMSGDDRAPVVVANKAFEERLGEFSPDGRWVAYETHESGRPEIVVQAFPKPSGVFHVSTRGGAAPRWKADGKVIYFIAPDGKMMSVGVTTSASAFEAGTPAPLFPTQIVVQVFRPQYAVAADGRIVVYNLEVDDASVSPITLILNWKP